MKSKPDVVHVEKLDQKKFGENQNQTRTKDKKVGTQITN